MQQHFDAIRRELQAAADKLGTESTGTFLAMLARVTQEVDQLQNAARLSEFGKQFKPAGELAPESAAPREFAPGQEVWTHEGYLGYVAGHDAKGKAVVNVVWQACEYKESDLHRIPGKHVLLGMKQ
jgi:hypothetical protein